ncbi:Transposon Tf2-8 polyprotein [Thelohanellus kitauei]|uniref:Transposon Tf2-8 polyprotein n=1 Tax=Thelohanellus kitauei TaxID=669202 RepID=A0A0C2IHZ5_THEKT|nr:Transposon Tf2-8 polyprotein [Thelohanellus kitauei]
MGLFRYTRLPFGVSSAPLIFQQTMDEILNGIERVTWYLDGIIVSGKDRKEHVERLTEVLMRLNKAGLTTKKKNVKFLGHKIDKNGIHPCKENLDAIRKMPSPSCVKELKSFLGSISYYSRSIQNLHTKCAPFYELTRKGNVWKWNQDDELVSDASNVGIGAVLLQTNEEGVYKPVSYSSRTLSAAERNYSTTDKEALAIIFGVRKFHQYLCGRKFDLITDHKPLESIFGERPGSPTTGSARLVRWRLILNGYNFEAKYKPGKENFIEDTLSRLPNPNTKQTSEERSMENITGLIKQIKSETIMDRRLLKEETGRDKILAAVKNIQALDGQENNNTALNTISIEEDIIFYNDRMIIPSKLRNTVVIMIHQGHPWIVAMKSLSKNYVRWPGIRKSCEIMVKSCKSCQENQAKPVEHCIFPWITPDKPWHRIHVDYTGPIEGIMWLAIVDASSKWVEVIPTKHAITETLIKSLQCHFSRFGFPVQIISDDGPQFISQTFKMFCKSNGIKHVKSTPYHSRTNGLIEGTIRTIKSRYLRSRETHDSTDRLNRVLFTCRNTIHSTTQRTPAELIFNYKVRNIFDKIKPNVQNRSNIATSIYEKYKNRHTGLREFKYNEKVWIWNNLTKKHTLGRVISKTGPLSYQVKIGDKMLRKHADRMKTAKDYRDDDVSTDNGHLRYREQLTQENGQEHKSIELRRSERLKNKQAINYDESSQETIEEGGA